MALGLDALLPLLAGFLIAFVVLMIILYVYSALVLMAIAKRTNTPNSWLAWIPIANIYLMTQIAEVPGWVTLSILLPFIPFVGGLAFLAVFIWLWWKIAEARHRPGWWGILISLVPVVNLVLIGMLAWSKE
ncbi:hypothetical protein J4230_01310 [Candidatus Woesearchaeota archaeon]|nr:hypothetical protein [Candidatus Woesearchaeota archaeon]